MKKLIALILAVAMLALGLVACDTKKEEKPEETEKTFTLREMSITLPAEFSANSTALPDGSQLTLVSQNGYQVSIYRVDHSSITPTEGNAFPTMEEFFVKSRMLTGIESAEDIETVDGLKIFNETKFGGSEPDFCVGLFESEGAFWKISAESWEVDYATLKTEALKWFKTVKFAEN